MPRQAREKSETGIYHIMLRGINKQRIFKDSQDKEKLFQTLKYYKKVSGFELYGYCFMKNHIHMLIKESLEPISLIMKRISSSYVYWYNTKYQRCGHLFQERFKSEVVEDDAYFFTVLRYIHQNPVKAGIVNKVSDFRWSSFDEYINKSIIIDTDYMFDMFSQDRKEAIKLFTVYTNMQNDDQCLDDNEKLKVSDSEIRAILLQKSISDTIQLIQLNKQKRNEIIKALKSIEGVTIRQLSRITGISKSVIDRV